MQILRQITQVICKGRVDAIESDALVLAHGRHEMPPGTLYIDCTASAVKSNNGSLNATEPIFQPGRILPQLVRAQMISFSSAVCAYAEAHHDDDATKNKFALLCPSHATSPPGFNRRWATWPIKWLGARISACAIGCATHVFDGFGKLTANLNADEADKLATLADIKQYGMAAIGNVNRLLDQQRAYHA